jgi:hypothetical protein
MRRIAVVVVVAGIGLTGCAGMLPQQWGGGGGPGTGAPCVAGVCKVAISVDKCVIATPMPDPIPVQGQNAHVEWEIDLLSWLGGNNFVAGDGIVVTDTKSQFQPEDSAGGKKYKLLDKNTVLDNFKYAIHVKSFWFGDCPRLDPTIINQG